MAASEKTTHRAHSIYYVSFLSQEVSEVLGLFGYFQDCIAALAGIEQTLLLGCITQGNGIVNEAEVFFHGAHGEVVHLNAHRGDVVFDSRARVELFVLLGAEEGAGEEQAARALVLVLGLVAELAGLLCCGGDLFCFFKFIIIIIIVH